MKAMNILSARLLVLLAMYFRTKFDGSLVLLCDFGNIFIYPLSRYIVTKYSTMIGNGTYILLEHWTLKMLIMYIEVLCNTFTLILIFSI